MVLPLIDTQSRSRHWRDVLGITRATAVRRRLSRLVRPGGEPDGGFDHECARLEEERRRAEALAELDRAKTAFFSNVSHEFRTPLTLMLGPIEEPCTSERGRAQGEELRLVHRNGLRLLKLVNTLLDFSRIEAGRAEATTSDRSGRVDGGLPSVFRSAIERAGLTLARQLRADGRARLLSIARCGRRSS